MACLRNNFKMAPILRSTFGRSLFLIHRSFVSSSCYSYSQNGHVSSGGSKDSQDKAEASTNSQEKAKTPTSEEEEPSFSVDEMILESATDSAHQDDSYDQHEEYEDDYDSEETIKSKILDAALVYVPQYGWCPKAIEAAAEAQGLSKAVEGMFPRGGGDLALHFVEDCNSRLAEHLASQSRIKENEDTPKKSTNVFLADAIETRLRMVTPHINTWPQAMAVMLLPQNSPDALRNVAHMVDDIWYHAGDTSTDMNWYAKRGALAALYGATGGFLRFSPDAKTGLPQFSTYSKLYEQIGSVVELYLVQDKSPDFQNTWRFLENRLNDAYQMAKVSSTLERTACDSANLLAAAFTTVRNMAGMNRRNR